MSRCARNDRVDRRLLELKVLVAVPRRHIGNDDPVAGLEAVGDLDTIIGGAAQADAYAVRFCAIIGDSEDRQRRVPFRLQEPLHKSRSRYALDGNGPARGEIVARFAGLRTDKLQVNANRAILHVGVDVNDSQRTSSGTRVPKPCTRQIMGPDSTATTSRALSSTVGEADRSRNTPKETAIERARTTMGTVQRNSQGWDRKRRTKPPGM